MPNSKAELKNLKRVNAALRKLPKDVRVDLQYAFDFSAYEVAARAKATVRRLTGALKEGIAWQSRPRSLSSIVTVNPETFYWRFLEFGTKTRQAFPFLRPAAAATRGDHDRRVEAALRKSLAELEADAAPTSSD